jgi:hypothetical protein
MAPERFRHTYVVSDELPIPKGNVSNLPEVSNGGYVGRSLTGRPPHKLIGPSGNPLAG